MPEVPGSAFLWRGIQVAVSVGLLAVAFMLLFKYLPDTPVAWGDVWLGALLTAILFTVIVNISSAYISRSNFEAYGAIGSVMALLVWIFLSSQVLFLGAEFTRTYATMFGSYREEPAEEGREQEMPKTA
jgi:membrane protein